MENNCLFVRAKMSCHVYGIYLNDDDAVNLIQTCWSLYKQLPVYNLKNKIEKKSTIEFITSYQSARLRITNALVSDQQLFGVLGTLKYVEFASDFNQTLQRELLPKSLKQMVLGDRFNQSLLPGVLPDGLKSLTLGKDYNHPLNVRVLPVSLQRLGVWISL